VRVHQAAEALVVRGLALVRVILLREVPEDALDGVVVRVRTDLQELVVVDERRRIHSSTSPRGARCGAAGRFMQVFVANAGSQGVSSTRLAV